MFSYLGLSSSDTKTEEEEQEITVETALDDDNQEAVETLSKGIEVDRVVNGRPIATPVTMMLDGMTTTSKRATRCHACISRRRCARAPAHLSSPHAASTGRILQISGMGCCFKEGVYRIDDMLEPTTYKVRPAYR